MSLIGIDVGSSAIKVVAYDVAGRELAGDRQTVSAHRPQPGHWEVDVLESRAALWTALGTVAAHPNVRRDPPVAVSFSSSGREVFPVAADGSPLGPCLMTADIRGDEVAAHTAALHTPEEWFRMTGHVPRRMDPVNRALWWRTMNPVVVERTRWFMNWHEYYALLLAGRPVVDWTDAGMWATYDLAAANWSPERVAEVGIDPRWLPEVQPSATPIGRLRPAVASEFGLPPATLVVTGAHDTYAASVGSGAVGAGIVSLATGSWHSFTLAVAPGYPPELVHDGVCVHPHPGPTGLGIFMGNPNGTCVIDWARRLTGLAIPDLEAGLLRETGGPGHLRADPSFSPLPEAPAEASLGGTITGFTLATSSVDLVRALMEAIAGRFSLALERLEQRGIASTLVRASGGGARSAWWMQLTADVAERPVEVVVPDEPGAFGAALLGGVGAGIYSSVSSAVHELVQVRHRYQPDRDRGALYAPVREMLSASRHDGAGAWPSAGSTTRRWPPRARNERCPDRTPRGAR